MRKPASTTLTAIAADLALLPRPLQVSKGNLESTPRNLNV
jgi:hypothetical protein